MISVRKLLFMALAYIATKQKDGRKMDGVPIKKWFCVIEIRKLASFVP